MQVYYRTLFFFIVAILHNIPAVYWKVSISRVAFASATDGKTRSNYGRKSRRGRRKKKTDSHVNRQIDIREWCFASKTDDTALEYIRQEILCTHILSIFKFEEAKSTQTWKSKKFRNERCSVKFCLSVVSKLKVTNEK